MIQARMVTRTGKEPCYPKTMVMRMTRRKGSGRSKAEALERHQQCPKSAKNITCREGGVVLGQLLFEAWAWQGWWALRECHTLGGGRGYDLHRYLEVF